MRTFNDEILRQLVDEQWDDKGINPEVGYRNQESNWVDIKQIICRERIKKGHGANFEVLPRSLIEALKKMINDMSVGSRLVPTGFKTITLFPQVYPYAPTHSKLVDGKIVVPNKYIWARFYGDPNPKLFWGDVLAEVRIRAVFDIGTVYGGWASPFFKRTIIDVNVA